MNEERRLLYALVAVAFHVVVAVLVVAAAVVGLAPTPWTLVVGAVWVGVLVIGAIHRRRIGLLLGSTIGTFLLWAVGTPMVT